VMSILDWLFMQQAPGATIAAILVAIGLTFVTSLANRLLTNKEQRDAWRREISAWNEEFKKARKSGDKKLLAKVQKQQSRIMKIQSKMAWKQMRVSLIFFVPILLLWQFLIGYYGSTVIAQLPWFDGMLPLTIVWWYPLCSLTSGILFSRLFGLGMGATE
jgi:uncharacterized membrane protein (DUF106 family)